MIIPAILEHSFEEIEKKMNLCQGIAKEIHFDFIDQSFSQNQTLLDPSLFSKYKDTFVLEAHLMVEEPMSYLDRLSQAGFKRFIGQVETMSDQVEFVAKGQELGWVGLALDLPTDLSEIKVSYEDLDQILLMAVKAGASGEAFDEGVIEKIKELRTRSTINIEVDGGVNEETLPLARNAGANIFCANSFLFNGDFKSNYEVLQKLL